MRVGLGVRVLLARYLTLSFDAAPNYKYMAAEGSFTTHVKHLSEIQIIKKHCNETKQKAQWRPEARSQEYHKQNTMRDIHAVIKSI